MVPVCVFKVHRGAGVDDTVGDEQRRHCDVVPRFQLANTQVPL